ncbi:hypothetical protein PABG_04482 [Paracoccidioides brasiliensis Pb03]|nr:hypothetical protein PABG_04482 [Paracoccidioides brasiliensis Pb03]
MGIAAEHVGAAECRNVLYASVNPAGPSHIAAHHLQRLEAARNERFWKIAVLGPKKQDTPIPVDYLLSLLAIPANS